MAGTKKKTSKKKTSIVTRGKRKECVARASIREGKGVVRVNSFLLSAYGSPIARSLISEPLSFAPEFSGKVDIDVSVHGGGAIGQAQACRTAVARALLKYSGDSPALKEQMAQADKFLLSEDSRRVEPKKYKGPKARARFQKSYR